MRELGILRNQAGDHGEVSGDTFLGLGLEGLQLVSSAGVQVERGDLVGNRWILVLASYWPELVLQAFSLGELSVASAAITSPSASRAAPPQSVGRCGLPLATERAIAITTRVTSEPAIATRARITITALIPTGRAVATRARITITALIPTGAVIATRTFVRVRSRLPTVRTLAVVACAIAVPT